MTKWAGDLAKDVISRQYVETNWNELVLEISDGIEEFHPELKKAQLKALLSTSLGQQTVSVKDHRNRELQFAVSSALITISPSWRPGKKYSFTSPSVSVLRPTPGEGYPGLPPQAEILVSKLVEIGVRELLG